MIVKDISSGEVFYDTGGDVYEVTAEFWNALEAGKVRYYSGEEPKPGVHVSLVVTLDIEDDDFEEKFAGIADSMIGNLVMRGNAPVDEIL